MAHSSPYTPKSIEVKGLTDELQCIQMLMIPIRRYMGLVIHLTGQRLLGYY